MTMDQDTWDAAMLLQVAAVTVELGRYFGGTDAETLVQTCQRWVREHRDECEALHTATRMELTDARLRFALLYGAATEIAADEIDDRTRAQAIVYAWSLVQTFTMRDMRGHE